MTSARRLVYTQDVKPRWRVFASAARSLANVARARATDAVHPLLAPRACERISPSRGPLLSAVRCPLALRFGQLASPCSSGFRVRWRRWVAQPKEPTQVARQAAPMAMPVHMPGQMPAQMRPSRARRSPSCHPRRATHLSKKQIRHMSLNSRPSPMAASQPSLRVAMALVPSPWAVAPCSMEPR